MFDKNSKENRAMVVQIEQLTDLLKRKEGKSLIKVYMYWFKLSNIFRNWEGVNVRNRESTEDIHFTTKW